MGSFVLVSGSYNLKLNASMDLVLLTLAQARPCTPPEARRNLRLKLKERFGNYPISEIKIKKKIQMKKLFKIFMTLRIGLFM